MDSGDLIEIDGSSGEGGGQILRTSLALSLVTGRPFRIERIRAGRKKPGLLNQHLTAANAAADISGARVTGNVIGSRELYFAPGPVRAGRYHFDVGSAGSCTLVLQTVLPALITGDAGSELILEGGTHNPFAPPFDFLNKTFLPLLRRMGPETDAELYRPGFYPAGGGKMAVSIEATRELSPLDLRNRGPIKSRGARALVARLPRGIAERELKKIGEMLSLDPENQQVEEISNSRGPGNVVMVEIQSEHITETFTGFGMRGVRAEQVAEQTAKDVLEYLSVDAPVGKQLADQLLIPLALAGGGIFKTLPLTAHTLTNIEVLKLFLNVKIEISETDGGTVAIEIKCP
jgi:RNA 3'-terminal phosphate cyclase (ATP)